MSCRQWSSVLLIFVWLCQNTLLAAQKTRNTVPKSGRLAWSELAPVLVERKAKITVAGGQRVEGEVLAVRSDEIVMDIRKRSDKEAYPKGQRSISRSEVAELRVIKDRGPGKLIGAILGTVGGIFTAGAMTYYAPVAGAVTGFFLVLPVMAVSGYYLGKAADVRTTRIRLEPEAAEAAQSASAESNESALEEEP